VTQVVECLPAKREALSSTNSHTKVISCSHFGPIWVTLEVWEWDVSRVMIVSHSYVEDQYFHLGPLIPVVLRVLSSQLTDGREEREPFENVS
jgi:hypothetical protein